MLYEVITLHLLVEPAVDRVVLEQVRQGGRIGDVVDGDDLQRRVLIGGAEDRITSYNVCYTKLLRKPFEDRDRDRDR